MKPTVLIFPGLGGSGAEHWQSIWEEQHPEFKRVEQAEWDTPVCSNWVEKLQQEVTKAGNNDVVLVAHSLACITVAFWAATYPQKIKAALLVAPPDTERADFPKEAVGFAPIPLQPLPFPAIVVASTNDEYISIERAKFLADSWGSEFVCVGAAGHINSSSGLGNWPQGFELLERLLR